MRRSLVLPDRQLVRGTNVLDALALPWNTQSISLRLDKDRRTFRKNDAELEVSFERSRDGKRWEPAGCGFTCYGGPSRAPYSKGVFSVRQDGWIYRPLVVCRSVDQLRGRLIAHAPNHPRQIRILQNSVGVVDTDFAAGISVASLTTGTLTQLGSNKAATALISFGDDNTGYAPSTPKWGGSGGTNFTAQLFALPWENFTRGWAFWANNGVLSSDGTVYAGFSGTVFHALLSAGSWNAVDQSSPALATYQPASVATGTGSVTQANTIPTAVDNRVHGQGVGWCDTDPASDTIASSGTDYTDIGESEDAASYYDHKAGYWSPTGASHSCGFTQNAAGQGVAMRTFLVSLKEAGAAPTIAGPLVGGRLHEANNIIGGRIIQ